MGQQHNRKQSRDLEILFGGDQEDDDLFREAMSDVRPINKRRRLLKSLTPPKPDPTIPTPHEELEEALTRDGVQWSLVPGYVEGGAGQSDRRLIRRLRSGRYAIQAQLDLHGLMQAEARERLDEFIRASYKIGRTCVRIITGKGINSPKQIPVLKNKVPQWLCQRKLAQYVIAFASAPISDGGSGALLVLLRKRARRPGKHR